MTGRSRYRRDSVAVFARGFERCLSFAPAPTDRFEPSVVVDSILGTAQVSLHVVGKRLKGFRIRVATPNRAPRWPLVRQLCPGQVLLFRFL